MLGTRNIRAVKQNFTQEVLPSEYGKEICHIDYMKHEDRIKKGDLALGNLPIDTNNFLQRVQSAGVSDTT